MALYSRSVASFVSFLFLTVVSDSKASKPNLRQRSQALFHILGGLGESCTNVCTQAGFACSYDSLRDGASQFTASRIEEAIAATGAKCAKVQGERKGRAFPLIDARNFCFGSLPNRTNFDCDAEPRMTEPAHRICSCFPTQQSLSVGASTQSTPKQKTESTREKKPVHEDSSFVPPGYSLTWRDDFDGKDLNTTNWSRGLVYDGDPSQHVIWDERQGGPHLLNAKYDGYILDEDSYVKDGKLMLANREHRLALRGTEPSGTYRYSSGWINSLHKRYFNGAARGSYLEIRANFPSGDKVWPAVWMVAEAHTWPPEIDIWEYFGVFFHPKHGVDEMHFRNIWGKWQSKEMDIVELPNFHEHFSGDRILGWLWTDKEMKWYIDGQEVATKTRGDDIPNGGWAVQDLCLILNNGLLADIDGSTTKFPNYLEIDYIALYQEPEPAPERSSNKASSYYEPEPGLAMVLGEPGESCTRACSRIGQQCSTGSLARGDKYGSRSEIITTSLNVGASCEAGIMEDDNDWDANPQISTESYCFPIPGKRRSNHDCYAVSDLRVRGKAAGQRVCSCGSTDTWN